MEPIYVITIDERLVGYSNSLEDAKAKLASYAQSFIDKMYLFSAVNLYKDVSSDNMTITISGSSKNSAVPRESVMAKMYITEVKNLSIDSL